MNNGMTKKEVAEQIMLLRAKKQRPTHEVLPIATVEARRKIEARNDKGGIFLLEPGRGTHFEPAKITNNKKVY